MLFPDVALLLLGIAYTQAAEMGPNTNLSSITWLHAVNSQDFLLDALKTDVEMLEADIVLGTLIDDPNLGEIPIMGHPPSNTSDLSLQEFLLQVLRFNSEPSNKPKGVKLDFKSTTAFEKSLSILNQTRDILNYPFWLNADIISGPVNSEVLPVDPNRFLQGSKEFNSSVLSIGWTTLWGSNYTDGVYTKSQIDNMITAIKDNGITKSGHHITFPVRAGIAAQSLSELRDLSNEIAKTNNVTLTVWSSAGDNVNIDSLRELIFSFGIDRVYLDVPEEVASRLNLGVGTGNSAIASRFSTFKYSDLIGLTVLTFSLYFFINKPKMI